MDMTLSPKQLRAVRLYVAGLTRNDVAERVAVSISTLKRWEAQDEFVAEVEAWQQRLGEALHEGLVEAERKALGVLMEAMDAEDLVHIGEGNVVAKPNWAIRVKVAQDFLNRRGQRGKPVEKSEQHVTELKGDLGELLTAALRDPGVRAAMTDVPALSFITPGPDGRDANVIDAEFELADSEGAGGISSAGADDS